MTDGTKINELKVKEGSARRLPVHLRLGVRDKTFIFNEDTGSLDFLKRIPRRVLFLEADGWSFIVPNLLPLP